MFKEGDLVRFIDTSNDNGVWGHKGQIAIVVKGTNDDYSSRVKVLSWREGNHAKAGHSTGISVHTRRLEKL